MEADFRSAVLLSHAALNDVSELFPLILAAKCKRGRYDQIIAWSKETFGENDVLSLMLQADHRWIYLWGEVRNAFEHPNPSYYVQVNNFRILASREIQLPTWQMKHPRLDVFKPQNMVQSLVLHRDNILSFFENLLLVMTDKTITFPVEFIDQEEEHRDPDCPKRYGFAGS